MPNIGLEHSARKSAQQARISTQLRRLTGQIINLDNLQSAPRFGGAFRFLAVKKQAFYSPLQ